MSLSSNKANKLITFERLAIPHLDFIYRSAYRLCGNRSDADNLSQETFRTAFERFDQLKDTRKIKRWLYMILHKGYLKKNEVKKKYP